MFSNKLPFIVHNTGFFINKIYKKTVNTTIQRSSIIFKMVKIGTHSGKFHCDEVLACYLLKTLPEYKDATIIRSRELSILDTCDIVVDVGGKYDVETHRYDHHMREFKETQKSVINRPGFNCNIKLSSAGLIYCHFGEKIIKHFVQSLNAEELDQIFQKIYETFIKEIDGIDNGVPMFDGEPLYRTWTDISTRVSRLNKKWNEPDIDEQQQFEKAMVLVGEEFHCALNNAAHVWLPARTFVKEAIEKRYEVHESGEIIEFGRCVPWKEHLFNLEDELKLDPNIKFIIFKDNNYRIQGVPKNLGGFICRYFLPDEWKGLRDDELSKVSGIAGCVFVHATGFIGGNLTRDGALKMAVKALEIAKSC